MPNDPLVYLLISLSNIWGEVHCCIKIGLKWNYYRREHSEESNEQLHAAIAREWEGAVAAWEEQVRDLNSRILDLNITLPT